MKFRLLSLGLALVASAHAADSLPHHVWLEAETFAPIQGANFAFQSASKHQAGAWGLAGPGVADVWSQGGDSEWSAIAARADEMKEVSVARECIVPADGEYTLWVRYADYRAKAESFGVRITQGADKFEPRFGAAPIVDELDPLKLLWDWAYGWARASVRLKAGKAQVALFTTGPAEARRQVDCLCLTTDAAYRPRGREKPDFAAWRHLRAMRAAGMPRVEALVPAGGREFPPPAKPPAFLWNTGAPWTAELKKPLAERVDQPFGVDEPLLAEFLRAHRAKPPLIYSDPLSGPVWHIPQYPAVFASGSPFLEWLDRHPERPFAMLLNYGDPQWPKDADRAAVRANVQKYGARFVGYVSGESLSHTGYDSAALEAKVRAAKSRADVLAALREVHTAAVVKKFTGYYGAAVSAEEAWSQVIPCLSANAEAFAHAECEWGVQRIGHENTANSPTLARRLAFLRGAARQFGREFADYQSCNFGDSATMFSRQAYFFPASSRYVLDNSYDVFAGAGTSWLWRDYLLWHLAGTSAFYNEQGVDLFWKPGGGAAGDDNPVQLSPKGKVAETALRLAHELPRGAQFTPVAFLVDAAHGWAQERFEPGAFGLDRSWNPAVLTPGAHEASLRAWFDVAYFPAPDTQNEPCTAVRQCFVNGIFGDIFDVLTNAPNRTQVLSAYPVIIAAGELSLSAEWGNALAAYMENGGTLVLCAGQCTGDGVAALKLAAFGEARTADSLTWLGEAIAAQTFRFHPLPAGDARVLASAGDGGAIATLAPRGKGRLITVGVPLGIALDERPVPLLGALMRHLVEGILPVRATGDVEWTLNHLEDGRWLVALLNNRGIDKPQHGIVPTRHDEVQRVKLRTAFRVASCREWQTGEAVAWSEDEGGGTATVGVPAGATRLVVITPR